MYAERITPSLVLNQDTSEPLLMINEDQELPELPEESGLNFDDMRKRMIDHILACGEEGTSHDDVSPL